ncbi:MAG: translocation/assembly module TamB [Dysgonamonadaceae bacterium]|nr:translocation/assembly module TamB [Dysgonamonadaceae bacterium]
MKHTKSNVKIGNLKFNPFNNIRLNDVYLEDLQGDTLLFAKTVNVKFDFFRFFKKQFYINLIDIDSFAVNIRREKTDTPLNFQFLIDAFATDATVSDSPFTFKIDRLMMNDGALSYNVVSEPIAKRGLFDTNHVRINDLCLNAESIDFKKFNVKLERLSFKEKCGFLFDDMNFLLKSDGQRLFLTDFMVRLPDSELVVTDAVSDFLGNYSFHISSSRINAADLICLSPTIKQFTEILSFSLTAEGRFPALNVTSFHVDYGKNCRFNVTANTTNVLNPKKAEAVINIDRLMWKGYLYRNIFAQADYDRDSLSIEINSDDVNLPLKLQGNARLTGDRQNMTLRAEIGEFRPHILHLTPADFPNSIVSCSINADVRGFNPEFMLAQISIDSLRFRTEKRLIEDPNVTLSYRADRDREKQWKISSRYLNFDGKGVFSFDGVEQSLRQAFPSMFAAKRSKRKKPSLFNENFDFSFTLCEVNNIANILSISTPLPDSVVISGKYAAEDSLVNFEADAFCIYDKQDTASLHLNIAEEKGEIPLKLSATARSRDYRLACNLATTIYPTWKKRQALPDMVINLGGGSLTVNEADFVILPAQIKLFDREYKIQDFAMQHSGIKFLNINGSISENPQDSLMVNIGKIKIETVLEDMEYDFPLAGNVSGEISLSRMMTAPRVVIRNFNIDSISFDNNSIGDLKLASGWSSARGGLWFRAILSPYDSPYSTISGFVRPEHDSITVNGDINGLKLSWFADYLEDNIYGLEGNVGLRFYSDGLISEPSFTGSISLENARIGIRKTGVIYEINDSINLSTGSMVFNDFSVFDRYGQKGKVNGSIGHKMFSDWKPDLHVDFNNFTVIDNAQQTDSLFFGLVRVNGRVKVGKDSRNWLISGQLRNGRNNSLLFNIPPTPAEARRYNMITFLGNEDNEDADNTATTAKPDKTNGIYGSDYKPNFSGSTPDISLPMKIDLKLSIDPNLSIGVLLNPATNDIARATGAGQIETIYDLNNLSLSVYGNYSIDKGRCTVTLKNITRKTFTIQNGSKLTFRGDPTRTEFDVTAVYSLKANPETLDATFAELTKYSKIPVNCQLTASGDLDRIRLDYSIVLPNEPDDVQKRLDNMLSDENIKIKQIACLLAFGTFTPLTDGIGGKGNSGIWTSLATAPISAQLNNLLSGVLKDNWSIGTNLHSEDNSFSNITMDVNISTSLFNDRLTLNSSIGLNNSTVQTGNQTNLTGDFDVEYKLSPGGNIALRFFSLTNNRFNERAKTTQGAGIIYRRKGKTFGQLWQNFKTYPNR